MKMEKRRPIWKRYFKRSYYLRHPLRLLREIRDNLRATIGRAQYGWAPRDVWSLGDWLLDILPQMLEYLADNGAGYPGDERFPTPEAWRKHLISISNLLENARDEARDLKNEYAADYHKELDEWFNSMDREKRYINNEPSEITEKYIKRDMELAEEQEAMIEEAFKLLLSVSIKSYWD